MHCPNPGCYESPERPHLLISERSGIEIDYCPKCRGVWLDRGELDKLIERAQEDAAQAQPEPARDHRPQQHQEQHYRPQEQHYKDQRHYDSQRKHYDDDHKHHNYGGHYGKPYKKKSILSEIFDF